MSAISRRDFLIRTATQTAAGFFAASAWELYASPLGLPIGCQTWPVRELIAKDFPGTIKQLAGAGFQSVELCSPVGHGDSGFAGLAKIFRVALRKIVRDAGSDLCEFSLWHRRIEKESGGPDRLGQGSRADANDCAEPRRTQESHHG